MRAGGPGPLRAREYEKDQVVTRSPARQCYYTILRFKMASAGFDLQRFQLWGSACSLSSSLSFFCLTQRRGERRGLVNEDSVPQNRDIFLFSGNHSASPLFLKSVSIIPFSPIRQAEGTPAMLMQSLCLSSRVSEDRLQAAGVDKRQVLFKMAGHQCGRRISAALFEWTSWQQGAPLNT